jgi:hypothetical protein
LSPAPPANTGYLQVALTIEPTAAAPDIDTLTAYCGAQIGFVGKFFHWGSLNRRGSI